MFCTRNILLTFSLAALGTYSAHANLLHRYSFDSNVNDSAGSANGSLVGTASVTAGQLELPGGAARTNYASIPIGSTIAASQSLTIETWFTLDTLQNWSKIWMFGTAGAQPGLAYLDFTPYTGLASHVPKIDFDSAIGTELNTADGIGDPALMAVGIEYYVATIYDATNNLMSLYVNGTLADSASMGGGNVSQLGVTAQNFIGAAVNFGDPDIDGRVNELRIWNNALSPAEISQHNTFGPNQVPEPGSISLGLAGATLLGLRRRRC